MFLRARPLMAKVKQTTGIKKVPGDVVPNLREVFIGLYTRILNELKKLPEEYPSRKFLVERTNFALKYIEEEEDLESIPSQICNRPCPVEEAIEVVRGELSEISGLVADWNSYDIKPLPSSSQTIGFLGSYENSNERQLLIQLYFEALHVVKKVPKNNKLRMFAESSITRKLRVCQEEDDWQSIKSKLDYEDPIQKAREELDHWILFFGPDAYPNRRYPHVLRTKEFCERFDAWRELTPLENLKINSTYQFEKYTPVVGCSI